MPPRRRQTDNQRSRPGSEEAQSRPRPGGRFISTLRSQVPQRPVPGPPTLTTGLIAVLLVLNACGREPQTRAGNQRPFARITGGIIEGDTVAQQTTIYWTGWDNDGIVDHYQFAFDIPDSLGLGSADDPDGLGAAWHDTTVTKAQFLLPTPEPDTILQEDGTLVFPDRYKGSHTFYLKAVDNEGAVSDADYIEFTARNVTPKTTIVVPQLQSVGTHLQVGKRVYISWQGLDPDKLTGSSGDYTPAFYEFKLIRLPGLLGFEDAQYAVDVRPGPDYPWHRVDGNTTSIELDLEAPQDYMFVVRAIDESGGIERKYVMGRNAFKMEALQGGYGRPNLKVREKTLGTHIFPLDGDVVDAETYTGACFRFEFSAEMESYGGVGGGYNWGIDVTDADGDGPASGFVGWTLIPYTVEPICFNTAGVHTITVKCRDTGGQVTRGTYVLNVVALPPRDREVLYVDDYYDPGPTGATDAAMDRKALEMLVAAGYPPDEIRVLEPWGAGDREGRVTPLRLKDISRYRLLVFETNGNGGGFSNARSALLAGSSCGAYPVLRAYLDRGGSLWVYGSRVFGAMKPMSTSHDPGSEFTCQGNLSYTRALGLPMKPGDFTCEYMRMCEADVRDVLDVTKTHGFLAGRPTPEAVLDGFPKVEVDSTTYNHAAFGGIPWVDAMFQPTFDLTGGLDTLYTMSPVKTSSPFRDKPVAFCYADPDPVPAHGPVAIFGFPFHLLKAGSAGSRTGIHGLARAMAMWFRRHQAPTGS